LILAGHQWAVQSAEFSRDGTRVLTTSDDNTARIWELTRTEETWRGGTTLGAERALGGCGLGRLFAGWSGES
jgi:hypothetical protein